MQSCIIKMSVERPHGDIVHGGEVNHSIVVNQRNLTRQSNRCNISSRGGAIVRSNSVNVGRIEQMIVISEVAADSCIVTDRSAGARDIGRIARERMFSTIDVNLVTTVEEDTESFTAPSLLGRIVGGNLTSNVHNDFISLYGISLIGVFFFAASKNNQRRNS